MTQECHDQAVQYQYRQRFPPFWFYHRTFLLLGLYRCLSAKRRRIKALLGHTVLIGMRNKLVEESSANRLG